MIQIQGPFFGKIKIFKKIKIFTSKVELSVALSAPDFGTNSHRGPIPVGRGSPGPQFVSTPEQIVSRSLSQEFLLPQPPSCELVMYKGWKESRCWIPSPPCGIKKKCCKDYIYHFTIHYIFYCVPFYTCIVGF